MGIEKFKDAQLQDIVDDPSKYGAPTFDEFRRHPEKWLGRADDSLSSADQGSQFLKNVKRHIYEIEGYRCKTIEEVEKIAASQGIPLRMLDYRAELVPIGGGKADILVKFISKEQRENRADW